MNNFLNSLKEDTNFAATENGATTHKSTLNAVYDLFAFGGSYRKRSEEDCIVLFSKAINENTELAIKCLFYLRDIMEGQGERRFFRVCYKWLCNNYPDLAERNMKAIAEDGFGRWDDIIYTAMDTQVEPTAIELIREQLLEDCGTMTPSLCAKWMPSENCSSVKTKKMANKVRKALGASHKEYRQMLSKLRKRINIIERLMSENRWDEIEFDKIPSKAGLKYKDAFERRELIAKKYREFMKDDNTKVNAAALYPQDVVHQVFNCRDAEYQSTERLALDKYWKNLKDIYQGKEENAIAVVDVSGSMYGTPMEAAIGLGAYIAERGKGQFANHFITFSQNPTLVEFVGTDIYDKVRRAQQSDWGYNTNIEAVFDLLLGTALRHNTPQSEMVERLYIFSDMEFDEGISNIRYNKNGINTLLESIAEGWKNHGYELPQLIFWNLNARQDNIPMLHGARFGYVSGFSPNMIDCILSGKDGIDLMLEKLNSERYKKIQ